MVFEYKQGTPAPRSQVERPGRVRWLDREHAIVNHRPGVHSLVDVVKGDAEVTVPGEDRVSEGVAAPVAPEGGLREVKEVHIAEHHAATSPDLPPAGVCDFQTTRQTWRPLSKRLSAGGVIHGNST